MHRLISRMADSLDQFSELDFGERTVEGAVDELGRQHQSSSTSGTATTRSPLSLSLSLSPSDLQQPTLTNLWGSEIVSCLFRLRFRIR